MYLTPFSYKVNSEEYLISFLDIVRISRFEDDGKRKVHVHLKEIEFCEIEREEDIVKFEAWLVMAKRGINKPIED